jgi:hypothetical protein
LNQACWAQELSVEDRACITKAAAKLPKVATIGQSRVVPQPQAQGRHEQDVYHVKVEIDVSVAGQWCIDGDTTSGNAVSVSTDRNSLRQQNDVILFSA